jgi:polysaccharide biosynthesis/export protein
MHTLDRGARRVLGLLAASWMVCAAALAQSPAPAAAATNAVPAEYRLGAGDVVRIVVFQNSDLTLETRVSEAGLISYPLVGSLRVGGLTVTAAEKLVADGLRNGNFVKNPQVTMVLLQVRGNQASVLGQVNRPGRYPLETADTRLTDLLAMAGGTAGSGSDMVVVTGTRNGQPFRLEVDLPTLFAASGTGKDVLILNNDTIWVDRVPIVYIYGEVQRPGPIRLEREMTLLQALAAGGGPTSRGTEKGIKVHRKGSDGKVQVFELGMTDALREGDVVFVRESLF